MSNLQTPTLFFSFFSFQLLVNFLKTFIMKWNFFIPVVAAAVITSASFVRPQASLTGAWQVKSDTGEQVLIFMDGYFSYASFNKANKKFIRTFGGTVAEAGGQLHVNIEFDTESKDNVGKHMHYAVSVSEKTMKLNLGSMAENWERIDDGKAELAGNWRITGRMNNNQVQPIQLSARKTLKLLSGTRFQWMAINTETKEFFGTGGGTYTFINGKYTENIEFFSRDSTRVGASLTFDGSVSGYVWTHKGLSSRGDPIHEEWTREVKQ
jgi:hypothetical protein